MKPLQLTMQAFGSFAEKTTVDFSKLTQNLFLVTGDTGAGKTTIFDAIVFALYGEASSGTNRKEGVLLQSQYADVDICPQVTLTFTVDETDDVYRVQRVPRHVRRLKKASTKGNMTKEESGSVELLLPDGTVYPAKETDAFIVELVGLSKNQFMQIAMIAQGEFMELLRAKSDIKKEIFRKLFHTELYEHVIRELERRKKEQEKEIAIIRTRTQTITGQIQIPEDFAFAEEMQMLHAQIEQGVLANLERYVELLGTLNEKFSMQLDVYAENDAACRKERDKTRDIYTRAQALEKCFAQRRQAKKELEEIAVRLEDAQSEEENARVQLAETEREWHRLSERATQAEQGLAALGRQERELTALGERCAQEKTAYERERKSYVQNKAQYDTKYQMFLDAQAGILAETLTDGMPCPVCGSLEHPKPASTHEGESVPDRKQLEQLQVQVEKERLRMEERAKQISVLTAERELKEEQLRLAKEENEKQFALAIQQKEQMQKIKQTQEQCWKELHQRTERIRSAMQICQTAEETIGDQKEPDMTVLREKMQVASEQAHVSERLCEQHRARLQTYQNCEKQLGQGLANRQKMIAEHAKLDRLYRLVSGNTKGARMDLETYVQRYYLEQVLVSANIRFREMSAGQFELRMYDLQKAGEGKNRGLDLMVFSTVTGREREIRTLSGGESFMAALALALGMADQIQMRAAAIHMDMLFIDEGFGSLDEHSRAQAVRVLKHMAEGSRLIGIISHVTELKAEIDNQLVVTKDNTGSHVRWEY